MERPNHFNNKTNGNLLWFLTKYLEKKMVVKIKLMKLLNLVMTILQTPEVMEKSTNHRPTKQRSNSRKQVDKNTCINDPYYNDPTLLPLLWKRSLQKPKLKENDVTIDYQTTTNASQLVRQVGSPEDNSLILYKNKEDRKHKGEEFKVTAQL